MTVCGGMRIVLRREVREKYTEVVVVSSGRGGSSSGGS